MVYAGVIRGKSIELETLLPYREGQPVTVSVEPVNEPPMPGTIAALLQAMREPPHLSREDFDALRRSIEEAKLPVSEPVLFDQGC